MQKFQKWKHIYFFCKVEFAKITFCGRSRTTSALAQIQQSCHAVFQASALGRSLPSW